VHVGGPPWLACLTLAATVRAHLEGRATGDRMHPVQQASLDHDTLQCGFCTPGRTMSAVAVEQVVEDIREFISGNHCRCSVYQSILAAVER
jgi:xanthine dehydrogenase YagT iron-sulfur-binding subunit